MRACYPRLVTMSREPDLSTDPRLLGILDELRAREPLCRRPEFGSTRADFAAQGTCELSRGCLAADRFFDRVPRFPKLGHTGSDVHAVCA